jgi:uncharacterized protein YyaL (SSP411 family)
MFQYSWGGTWKDPHFEKIMPVNAGALATYADAYALTRDARWLADARTVWRWLAAFMTAPDGAFYASQDADVNGRESSGFYRLGDAERRRVGVPRVDARVYARENGLAIQALLRLYAATGEEALLARAVRAADAILAGHKAEGGGLLHERGAGEMLHLSDQAEFGRALVALTLATGDRRFVTEALALAQALKERFASPRGGFRDTTEDPHAAGVFAEPLVSLEPNAATARFLLPLSVLVEDEDLRAMALSAIGAVSAPAVLEEHGRHVGGLLLAVEDALASWARIEVVGPRGDPAAKALFEAARRLTRDRPDVVLVASEFPAGRSGDPHALVCGRDYCSDPVKSPEDLRGPVRKVVEAEGP